MKLHLSFERGRGARASEVSHHWPLPPPNPRKKHPHKPRPAPPKSGCQVSAPKERGRGPGVAPTAARLAAPLPPLPRPCAPHPCFHPPQAFYTSHRPTMPPVLVPGESEEEKGGVPVAEAAAARGPIKKNGTPCFLLILPAPSAAPPPPPLTPPLPYPLPHSLQRQRVHPLGRGGAAPPPAPSPRRPGFRRPRPRSPPFRAPPRLPRPQWRLHLRPARRRLCAQAGFCGGDAGDGECWGGGESRQPTSSSTQSRARRSRPPFCV